MRDSYDILFEHYDRDIFFSESLKSIIYIDESKIKIEWDNLKNRLFNNELTYIRGYGRDAKGTIAFLELYKNLFSNLNIKKDSSNNNVPTILMSRLTGLNKKLKKDTVQQERIQNYQISHLFGKTKNPLLFSAPWNFAYIPKYIDPFTGHETQGEHSRIFF
jgi:hypothetical protein